MQHPWSTANAGAVLVRNFKPHKIQFCLQAFCTDAERPRSHANLRDALGLLTRIDMRWLREHPRCPLLYYSGVRYEEEPLGEEDWCDVATVLQQGWGDCEDLACWRAAELLLSGRACWPDFSFRKLSPTVTLYHIFVRFPDGSIDDPSRRLGMGNKRSQYEALDQYRALHRAA